MEFSNRDLDIMISCVNKQIRRFDETWGDAKWRRENKIDPRASFFELQHEAREQADNLLVRLQEELRARKADDKHG